MDVPIELELKQKGARSANELASLLKVSQPTISRRLARMGSRIVRLGRGRSTLYALSREIPLLGSSWPLYRMDETGRPHREGTLHALHARQWALEQTSPWDTLVGDQFALGLFPDLPWFLYDLRPQGFLGRAFARNYSRSLPLPPDPNRWQADEIVRALVQYGNDLPGAWILGEPLLQETLRQQFSPREWIPENARAEIYPLKANAALAGEWPGFSAGGEQPKFTGRTGTSEDDAHDVIVKFSGSGDRAEDERWGDLLLAEHLAATVLMEAGVPASETRWLRAGGRTFLEATRFDRTGAYGRRGLVSLLALDAAFFGEPFTPWTAAADRLEEAGWITSEDADRLRLLWWFGTLIGNTDMHYGNISLFLTPTRPLALAPSYDMLPMLYRPDIEGRLAERIFAPPPPPPEALPLWKKALEMADRFWTEVAESSDLTRSFRQIAKKNRGILSDYRKKLIP